MTEIKFDGPPPERKRGNIEDRSHQPIAEALMSRPGEWAIVKIAKTASAASSAANYIRNAKSSAYDPAGSFESVSRKVDGEFRVYARFVGAESDGPPPGAPLHHAAVAAALKAKPREWSLIKVVPSEKSGRVLAGHIRRAMTPAYNPAGSFEAEYQSANGAHQVYARYVGAGGAA